MADSDGEYVDDLTEDEINAHQVTRGGISGAKSSRRRGAGQPAQPKARWEDIQRSWDNVVEGADGSISGTVVGLLEAGKRKRLLKDTTPLQRGIIRHLMLVLDLSLCMVEKDLQPTRYLLTIRYAQEFVTEFFEQNPISQLGVIGMRDGLAVRISDMTGNPTDHIIAIQALRPQEPKGLPSLQNVLEMARGVLFHTPSHSTREVVMVLGGLSSSDPGDIHQTINALVTDKIRVGIVGLAAQVAVCREIVVKTNDGDDSAYGVVLNEGHYHDLLMEATTPPVTRSEQQSTSSLLMMGFPSRIVEDNASLCACHSKLTRGGYLCSRCTAKVCSLPAECAACGLTLILSTHLARSYQHLFPLRNWVEVPWQRAARSACCFACQTRFPDVPRDHQRPTTGQEALNKPASGTSPSSRYECTVCKNHFCVDCDVWSHEVVHNCPGCQSMPPPEASAPGHSNGVNGSEQETAMDID
ncbi:MAG: hypothetical protein M1815_000324 [Lichina confinis]|nr:MAG: hypothetical protein M1815_000324 [Lichina confinis]